MKKLLIVLIFKIIIIPVYAQSLDRALELRSEIHDKLVPIIGDSLYVIEVEEIDSLKINEYTKDEFTDPYGTLTGCTIFAVSPTLDEHMLSPVPGAYWFGIFKDGNVIWLSDSLFSKDPLDSHFMATLDVNKDGKVDIVNQLTWVDITQELEGFLYIISWDGHNGTFINDGGKHSKISNYKGFFQPIDLNYDGIYEFESDTWHFSETTREWDSSKVVCCWNGEKYGIFDSCPQWPGPIVNPYYPYTRANDFSASLETKVVKSNGKFEYRIKIRNLENSKQNIKSFYFNYPFDSLYYVRPLGKDYGATRLFNYYAIIGFIINMDSLEITPGDSIEYVYRSDKIPKISQSYLQAPFEWLKFLGNDINKGENYRDNNVLHNSVKKKTLAPAEPPNPFIPNEFIDTLISYADSSYTLGWIKDEQTRDKYDNYFNSAKNYLNRNKNNAAKSELQKVLTDCNTDSSNVLTSEAYALLYFNTDYLIKQIPEGEPGLPVKLEDRQGSLLQGGSLQYYDSGWKDANDYPNKVFLNTQKYLPKK